MNITRKKGFTLTEIMVVVLITTVVFAAIHATFIVGNRTFQHYSDSVAVKSEIRRAMTGLIRDLREAENIRINQNRDGTAIHFYRPSLGDISYVWKKEGENAHRIIKLSPLGPRIAAKNISALTFRKSKNAIFINMAASKDAANTNLIQVALREKITLRPKASLYTK